MASLLYRVRQKSHRPCPFHGFGDHSLVFGAIAGPARRNNFCLRIHELPHEQGILVVNGIDVVGAKIA
jgi:hypothetical protein